MIEVKNLTKTFKREKNLFSSEFNALEDVSFHIGENEIIGFLGANGAGKTTTNKILMDFIPKTSGEIIYDKKMGSNFYSIRQSIGYLPERPYFYPHLTGQMFLEYLANLSEVPENQAKDLIIKWTKKLKINFALKQKVRSYSKGMLQRLGLASVLLHDPKVIILDEPLSGLDPIGRMDIKNIILDLYQEGKTVFFSSHIVSDVEAICKKVVFLEKGKLVYDGSIDKLLKDYGNLHYECQCFIPEEKKLSIEPRHQEEGVSLFEFEEKRKKDFLQEITENNIDLISLKQIKPSLEEVIYKIRES